MLTSNRKGAIAETSIAAAAVKLGIDVYRPYVEGGRYDLIFGFGSHLVRVQCKWGRRVGDVLVVNLSSSRRTTGDRFIRRQYSADEIDAVAAYSADLDETYFLPIELVAGRPAISLRLAPCRNNQRSGVNFASSYRLGAIAQLGERLHGMQEVAGSSPASSIAGSSVSRCDLSPPGSASITGEVDGR